MYKEKIIKKFGKEYQVDQDTFIMGIHYLLGERIAQRFKGHNVILDSCCGAGFMTVALAKYANQVIAIDINSQYLKQAKNNAKIAGIFPKVRFILGDVLNNDTLNKIPKINGAFLDPDWAIVEKLKTVHTSKLSGMQPPLDKLFAEIYKKTQNIAFRLPREANLSELGTFPPHKLEKVYLVNDFKFYVVYFGKLAKR